MPLSAKAAVQLGKASEIKAAMLLHPSFVTPDDIKCEKVFTLYCLL